MVFSLRSAKKPCLIQLKTNITLGVMRGGRSGLRLLPHVIEELRRPQREEYQPRTAYSLFNCFTDVLGRERQSRFPAESALATMRLSELLSPPHLSLNGTESAIVTAA